MKQLRDYQRRAVDVLRERLKKGHERLLLVASTGSGKTRIFTTLIAEILGSSSPHMRVLLVVTKEALVPQIERELQMRSIVDVGVYCATHKRYEIDRQIVVGTLQRLARTAVGKFDLVIFDEAHRLNDKEDGQFMPMWNKIKEASPTCRIIGATATPFTGGRYIYNRRGDTGRFFPEVTFSIGIKELTRDGYLVPAHLASGAKAEVFSIEKLRYEPGRGDYSEGTLNAMVSVYWDKIMSQVKDALLRLDGRKKVAWACINITHAERVRDVLVGMKELATCVHSKMVRRDEVAALELFTKYDVRHMVFVTKLSEGFDYAPTDAVVLMRPMRSPTLMIQTIGRALRTYPGKSSALVLDYGQTIRHCGSLDRPVVQEDLLQMVDGKLKRQDVEDAVNYRVVTCDACGLFNFLYEGDKLLCKNCGAAIELGFSSVLSLATTSFTGESLYSSEECAIDSHWIDSHWVPVENFRVEVRIPHIKVVFDTRDPLLGTVVTVASSIWLPSTKAKWAMRNAMQARIRRLFAPLMFGSHHCTYQMVRDVLDTHAKGISIIRHPPWCYVYKNAEKKFIIRAFSFDKPEDKTEIEDIAVHAEQGVLFGINEKKIKT
jgi:DNA repair protein RadD